MADREATAQKLRDKFVNREAIYLYKGAALRVRVMNIRLAGNLIMVDIEEIPTAGFEFEWLRSQLCLWDQQASPLRWSIGASDEMVHFSDHDFSVSYGGCSMYFAADIIEGVVDLAARWPRDLSGVERYNAVWDWLSKKQ